MTTMAYLRRWESGWYILFQVTEANLDYTRDTEILICILPPLCAAFSA